MRKSSVIDSRQPKPYRRRRRGQGLVEYSLLLAFIGLVCIAIMSTTGSSTAGVWSSANNQLAVANGATPSAGSTGGSDGSGGGGDHHHDDGWH
jgi:Flp pilus assembly pilin Flp